MLITCPGIQIGWFESVALLPLSIFNCFVFKRNSWGFILTKEFLLVKRDDLLPLGKFRESEKTGLIN